MASRAGNASDRLSRLDVILCGGTLRDMKGNLPMFPYCATVAVVAGW
jgi:hypothetical protein